MRFATRPAVAVLIVGVALIGALLLHRQRERYHYGCTGTGYAGNTVLEPCVGHRRPGWADPAALGVLVLGAAAATGVVAAGFRGSQPG